MDAYYSPAAGIVVRGNKVGQGTDAGTVDLEQCFGAGGCDDSEVALVAGYAATLGLAALDRQDVIMDGKNGVVYFARQPSSVKPNQHNRLGADFVTSDLQHDDLVAHVAAGSPAEMAGIRNGDLLLKKLMRSMSPNGGPTLPCVRADSFGSSPPEPP